MISANEVRGTPSPCEECKRKTKDVGGCYCKKWLLWFSVVWADIRFEAGKAPKLKAISEDGRIFYEEE